MVGINYVEYCYSKVMLFIFVGGVLCSGIMLMCVMLDVYFEVCCGEEICIILCVLVMCQVWFKFGCEKLWLDEVGVMDEVLDVVMQVFILEVIVKYGELVCVFCNKDLFMFKFLVYLLCLFFNFKFLLMVWDG